MDLISPIRASKIDWQRFGQNDQRSVTYDRFSEIKIGIDNPNVDATLILFKKTCPEKPL